MKSFFVTGVIALTALVSCGGGGGGGEEENNPQAKVPSSLHHWAIAFTELGAGTKLIDIQCVIISDSSGVIAVPPMGSYESGLNFKYEVIDPTGRAQLVIRETGKENFTITLNMAFDQYNVQQGDSGSTAIGRLESWSFVSDEENLSGSSGRFAGRRQ